MDESVFAAIILIKAASSALKCMMVFLGSGDCVAGRARNDEVRNDG